MTSAAPATPPKLSKVLDYMPCDVCLEEPSDEQELLCSVCHRLDRTVTVKRTETRAFLVLRPAAPAPPDTIDPAPGAPVLPEPQPAPEPEPERAPEPEPTALEAAVPEPEPEAKPQRDARVPPVMTFAFETAEYEGETAPPGTIEVVLDEVRPPPEDKPLIPPIPPPQRRDEPLEPLFAPEPEPEPAPLPPPRPLEATLPAEADDDDDAFGFTQEPAAGDDDDDDGFGFSAAPGGSAAAVDDDDDDFGFTAPAPVADDDDDDEVDLGFAPPRADEAPDEPHDYGDHEFVFRPQPPQDEPEADDDEWVLEGVDAEAASDEEPWPDDPVAPDATPAFDDVPLLEPDDEPVESEVTPTAHDDIPLLEPDDDDAVEALHTIPEDDILETVTVEDDEHHDALETTILADEPHVETEPPTEIVATEPPTEVVEDEPAAEISEAEPADGPADEPSLVDEPEDELDVVPTDAPTEVLPPDEVPQEAPAPAIEPAEPAPVEEPAVAEPTPPEEPAAAEPAAPEPSPEPPTPASTDLDTLPDVKPFDIERLQEAGLAGTTDLAGRDPWQLADQTGLSAKRLEKWIWTVELSSVAGVPADLARRLVGEGVRGLDGLRVLDAASAAAEWGVSVADVEAWQRRA